MAIEFMLEQNIHICVYFRHMGKIKKRIVLTGYERLLYVKSAI